MQVLSEPYTYFELMSNVYAAQYKGQTILLDISQNEYFSLDIDVMDYFQLILSKPFIQQENLFQLKENSSSLNFETNINELNGLIQNLLAQHFIKPTTHSTRNNKIAKAVEPIGLTQVEWMPTLTSSSNSSFLRILEAYIALFKSHRALKKNGIKGLLRLMDQMAQRNQKRNKFEPKKHEIEKLVLILDRACIYFPAKTLCLIWACVLTTLFIKRGWKCTFKIGIQTQPFYAHAWVESQNNVINDDSLLQQRLATILETHY